MNFHSNLPGSFPMTGGGVSAFNAAARIRDVQDNFGANFGSKMGSNLPGSSHMSGSGVSAFNAAARIRDVQDNFGANFESNMGSNLAGSSHMAGSQVPAFDAADKIRDKIMGDAKIGDSKDSLNMNTAQNVAQRLTNDQVSNLGQAGKQELTGDSPKITLSFALIASLALMSSVFII